MLNREHVVIPDIYADSRVPHDAYRPTFVRSLAIMPIRKLDPIGAIGTYWARQHVPSDEDLLLLQALADSTAVAIENIGILERLDYQVRLLHTLAHEVRNPLTAAQALLQQLELRQGPAGSREVRPDGSLELIGDALCEAMRIVNEQLDVSKLRSGDERVRAEDVALAPLLVGLRNSYAALCHQRVSLVADVDRKLTARTGPASPLTDRPQPVEQRAQVHRPRRDKITAARTNGQLKVVVADTGVGVASEDQERIFDEFEQVDGAQPGRRPGTGLGLPLARRLARALGSEIELRSELGIGSAFSLVLPA